MTMYANIHILTLYIMRVYTGVCVHTLCHRSIQHCTCMYAPMTYCMHTYTYMYMYLQMYLYIMCIQVDTLCHRSIHVHTIHVCMQLMCHILVQVNPLTLIHAAHELIVFFHHTWLLYCLDPSNSHPGSLWKVLSIRTSRLSLHIKDRTPSSHSLHTSPFCRLPGVMQLGIPRRFFPAVPHAPKPQSASSLNRAGLE